MQLTYQAVNDKGENGKKKTGTAAKQILSYNGLDDKIETDRIYTAKVKVYKSGAAEKGFRKMNWLCLTERKKIDNRER